MSNLYRNWLRTLGAPEDPVATDTTSEWSLVSLMKALYSKISDGSFAAAVTGRAEGLVSICQGAAAQCAHFVRLARASKLAAATSATNAATSETNASTSAATASAAEAAVTFSAGTALYGQRAKRDRVAAAASATAAAASAASITSEGLVLGVQVYS